MLCGRGCMALTVSSVKLPPISAIGGASGCKKKHLVSLPFLRIWEEADCESFGYACRNVPRKRDVMWKKAEWR
ncbi:hypothetical protein BGX38DRAFT_1192319, partial [Terfezia claveryi]